MKLAEQIKNNLRVESGLDFTKLAKDVSEIFAKHPTDYICISPSHKYDVSEKDHLGMWRIGLPKEWMVDVECWMKGNGFKVTERRGQNGQLFRFYIHLI